MGNSLERYKLPLAGIRRSGYGRAESHSQPVILVESQGDPAARQLFP
jgi:hypothetical protein